MPEGTDGSDISEWFIHNSLLNENDIAYTRMYEKQGVIVSEYESDIALTKQNLINEWNNGYGMIFWVAHGQPKSVARTIWTEDANSNEIAETDEMDSPPMLESKDAELLLKDKPGFLVAISCEIGSLEVPYNLSYSLLLNGTTIGVVSSSSLTPGTTTDWADFKSALDISTFGAENLGVYFFDELIKGKFAGKSVSDVKHEYGYSNNVETYAGKMMLNYIGDPSLTLYDTSIDILNDNTANQDTLENGCSCSAIEG